MHIIPQNKSIVKVDTLYFSARLPCSTPSISVKVTSALLYCRLMQLLSVACLLWIVND